MSVAFKVRAIWLLPLAVLSACAGGGDGTAGDEPVNIDYSTIKIADSQDAPLVSADDQTLLGLLRNGLRLSLQQQPSPEVVQAAGSTAALLPGAFSDTTVQVDGVDEGDAVKYDGKHIYAIKTQSMPDVGAQPGLGIAVYWPSYESALTITATNAATATTQSLAEFRLPGRQSTVPLIYQVKDASQATNYVAAISQTDTRELVIQGVSPLSRAMRVSVALLDVRDPLNVSQAWKLEVEGKLRASRQIGDTLYLVSSYWPQLPILDFLASTKAERQANERLVRSATSNDLLPHSWQNDGLEQLLARPSDCLVPTVAANDAYRELLFITAINLRERRIANVACASVGANGIYMSQESLYVGGESYRGGIADVPNAMTTVLHKFALTGGTLEYRASGRVAGTVGWSNSSYFMDEYQGDLRILTTRYDVANSPSHSLNVLREDSNRKLALLATLPNAAHPEPIGKPGEQVRAVRFASERAYVVTFLQMDPLYVLNLSNPADPVIAGELNVRGFSTYLKPLGQNYLLGVGQQADANGRPLGAKVELFDIRDIAHPSSVGSKVFGRSWSESLFDFHALTFLAIPGAQEKYRLALPLTVYDTPVPGNANYYSWTYTGLHLFEISGLESASPLLQFQGVLKADEPGQVMWPSYPEVSRSVLHDDSVFYIFGDRIISSLWQNVSEF